MQSKAPNALQPCAHSHLCGLQAASFCPPTGAPGDTFITDDVLAARGPRRCDKLNMTVRGEEAEELKGGIGFRRGIQMNIWPAINRAISVQASAARFELEAQALLFYDAINVRAERWEGEKYSRCAFYIRTFDGIPDGKRFSQPQSAKAEFLMFSDHQTVTP